MYGRHIRQKVLRGVTRIMVLEWLPPVWVGATIFLCPERLFKADRDQALQASRDLVLDVTYWLALTYFSINSQKFLLKISRFLPQENRNQKKTHVCPKNLY